MKTIKAEIKTKSDHITIVPVGDVHIGDKQFDRKLFLETLKRIETDPDCYTVLLGDLMNTAIKSSVSDVYGEEYTVMEQLQECVKLFGSLAASGKILAILPGNHDNRIFKTDNLSITRIMAEQLKLSDRFSATTALLWLQIQKPGQPHKASYSCYITHGTGIGGRKPGGRINRLVDYAMVCDADLFICAHTHSPAVVRQSFFRVDRIHGVVSEHDMLFVNSNAFLKYGGGYRDLYGYTPTSRKTPEIILGTDYKHPHMEAVL